MRCPVGAVFFFAALFWPITAPAAEIKILSGKEISLAGKRYMLAGIDVPTAGQVCILKNERKYDCAEIARTALLDLTVASRVTCRPKGAAVDGAQSATCQAGGFDLSRNMVHTGWALAWPRENNRLLAVEKKAQEAGRGLWRGSFEFPWLWRQKKP